jgi:hypothetical protein
VTANEIAANTITAGKIQAGAIGTTELAASAITASKMFIGAVDNLVLDADCRDTGYWTPGANPGPVTMGSGLHGTAWVGDTYMQFPCQVGGSGIYMPPQSCKPGDAFFVSANMGESNGANLGAHLGVIFWDGVKSVISTTNVQSGTVNGGPYVYSGSVTAPSNCAYISWYATWDSRSFGNCTFNQPVLRRMYTGTLIVDGSIAASEMAANSITAGAVAAGAINATSILVNDIVVTGHLVTNSVNSNLYSSSSVRIRLNNNGTSSQITSITFTQGYDNAPVFVTLNGQYDSSISRERLWDRLHHGRWR